MAELKEIIILNNGDAKGWSLQSPRINLKVLYPNINAIKKKILIYLYLFSCSFFP